MRLFKKTREICIIGIGRFGQSIVQKLLSDKENNIRLVLIDQEEKHLLQFKDEVDNIYVADCADRKTLESINVKDFDVVIVASSDNIEIVAALLEIGVKTIIARASNSRHSRVLRQIGVNWIVSPEEEAGKKTAILVSDPTLTRFSESIVQIQDEFVSTTIYITNPEVFNKKISELGLRNKYEVSVSLITRNSKVFLPSGDFEILEGDLLTFIGKLNDIIRVTEFCTKMSKNKEKKNE
ncbi:TrkA family potassium uptake protein [Mycoplasma enhydrae]|uniref:potassium channel family protein n=1 Tax=Mycoplasma enhydrae TaxID=2499220 RepID=UPI00197C560D|nr:TrkA family potassium uptake protein [Mycoplasma enhydrae]MBN4089430.1 TrkA family potassium uptake protein [Mycoplasma enhydrae]MCV3733486.1 TrkA family potassium uptake protein [Mycoplasma enhydrae]MCV3753266.1 TrkA family potassium uptake protein [Mycoplasma enhydrae]